MAARWDETFACVNCGGWNARWRSTYAGHEGVEHDGDLSQYCRDCKCVNDILLCDMEDVASLVRLSPEDVDWIHRDEWWHWGSIDWWEDCPSDVLVHVGARETSEWLSRITTHSEGGTALHRVRILGSGKPPLGKDIGDGWGSQEISYLNAYEFPGRISIYLPKNRLELIDKVVI